MRKLLRANFARMWKDKVLWIGMAVMFLAGVFFPVARYVDNRRSGWETALETGFFVYAVLGMILISVFTALFVGTEYGDGTIRNKIVVGHKRGTLYLANLMVCVAAGFILCIAYLLPGMLIGITLMGTFMCGVVPVILYVLTVFAMMAAVTALFTMAAMLCQNRAHTAAICILLSFFLLFAGAYIHTALEEPEYYDSYVMRVDGTVVQGEKQSNPAHLTGGKRAAYEFMLDFIPGGQVIQITAMEADSLGSLALYDLIILAVATGGGLALFKRKDIK